MNSGFQMDTDINRRLTLNQTKQAALYALQNYDVDWSLIHFIQVSEHVTFRIQSSEENPIYCEFIHGINLMLK